MSKRKKLQELPRNSGLHKAGELSPSVQTIAEAIKDQVGNIDTFLAAQDQKDQHGVPLEYTPEQRKELAAQLDEAIMHTAKYFAEKGWTAADVTRLADTAWRTDLGATFMQKTVSNAIAYLPASSAVILASILLTPILGPIPMIFVGLGIGLGVAYKYSVHALKAAGKVDGKINDEETGHGWLWKICPSKGPAQALGKEVLADLGGRSGLRLLATAPLRLLKFALNLTGAAPGFASVLGTFIIGPVAAVVGPPTNGLMQMFSKMLHGKGGQRSAAPLFGIRLKDGQITIDIGALERNIAWLSQSGMARAWQHAKKMGHEYGESFSEARCEEVKKGMTREKTIEWIFGSSAVGSVLGSGVGVEGAAIDGAAGSVVGTLGGIAASFFGWLGNVMTRGEVGRHAPAVLTDAKKPVSPFVQTEKPAPSFVQKPRPHEVHPTLSNGRPR